MARILGIGIATLDIIDRGACDWLLFVGRYIDETARLLALARRTQPQIPRSVEIEKPRAELERLFEDAALLLFSRAYVHARGGDEPAAFLRDVRLLAPHTDLVLAWGEAGTLAQGSDGGLVQRPFSPLL